jgi:hypothetical protein
MVDGREFGIPSNIAMYDHFPRRGNKLPSRFVKKDT